MRELLDTIRWIREIVCTIGKLLIVWERFDVSFFSSYSSFLLFVHREDGRVEKESFKLPRRKSAERFSTREYHDGLRR